MSVAKIIEISASSPNSFEEAITNGVSKACKTVKNVSGAWVKEQKLVIEDGKVTSYRVLLKLTFLLD